MKTSYREESEARPAAWEMQKPAVKLPGRCFRPKSRGKDTLPHVEMLQSVQCAPGSQLLWAVSHSGGGLGNASAYESFLSPSLTPVPIPLTVHKAETWWYLYFGLS